MKTTYKSIIAIVLVSLLISSFGHISVVRSEESPEGEIWIFTANGTGTAWCAGESETHPVEGSGRGTVSDGFLTATMEIEGGGLHKTFHGSGTWGMTPGEPMSGYALAHRGYAEYSGVRTSNTTAKGVWTGSFSGYTEGQYYHGRAIGTASATKKGIVIDDENSEGWVDPFSDDVNENEAVIAYVIGPDDFSGELYLDIKDSEDNEYTWDEGSINVGSGKGSVTWNGKVDDESVDQTKNPYYITLVLNQGNNEVARSNQHRIWVGRPVILVHGIWSNPEMWDTMRSYLESEGFYVENSSYAKPYDYFAGFSPSTNGDIKSYSKELSEEIEAIKKETGAKKVDLVCHSMGGLVSRWYTTHGYRNDVTNLIMIGTPNHGSELFSYWHVGMLLAGIKGSWQASIVGETLTGTAGIQMTPYSPFLNILNYGAWNHFWGTDIINTAIHHEVIAGTEGFSFLLGITSLILLGDDDGVVRVSSARLDGVNLQTVPYNHLQECHKYETFEKVVAILREDAVDREQSLTLTATQQSPTSLVQKGPVISGKIFPGEALTYEMPISATSEAVFILTWLAGDLNLTLITPNGSVVNASVAADNPNITSYQDENITLEGYAVRYPASGIWEVTISAINISGEGENFMVLSLLETNITLSVSLQKYQYEPNENINITANLSYGGEAVMNASVIAKIKRPDNTTDNVSLFDDGLHTDNQKNDGIYANAYGNASLCGIYDITVAAYGEINEEQFGREAFTTVWVEQYPDLTLLSSDISFSNDTPSAGDNITLNATIHNIGDADATDAAITFYDGDPASGTLIGEDTITVSAGGSSTAFIPWVAEGGAHEIYVVISPYNDFLENDYSNNTAHDGIQVNKPIVASFTYCPENPLVNQEIIFGAFGSSDPDCEIVAYEWDFGDGDSGSGEYVTHTYAEAGDYEVTLDVRSEDGDIGSVTLPFTVFLFPPDISVDPESLQVTLSEGEFANEPIIISNTGDAPLKYQINIGIPIINDSDEGGLVDIKQLTACISSLSNNVFFTVETYASLEEAYGIIWLDTDQDPSTGAIDEYWPEYGLNNIGADYALKILLYGDSGETYLLKWIDGYFEVVSYLPLPVSVNTDSFSVSVPLVDINDDGIMDVTLVLMDNNETPTDIAPDAGRGTTRSSIDWLSESPTTGEVLSAGEEEITITFDATNLEAGEYAAIVEILNNDQEDSLLNIPMTVYVIGGDVISCDAGGNETNQFIPNKSVYVKASGLEANTNYKIWIQDDPVADGDALILGENPLSAETPKLVTIGADGRLPVTLIWSIPSDAAITHAKYDIILDKQDDGENTDRYNSASDGIDSAIVAGIVAPVPEPPTIILFSVGLLALAGMLCRKDIWNRDKRKRS